ncbi:MAG: LuxR C-terminal-related transcriptional regulator [Tessaracoccus sp.]
MEITGQLHLSINTVKTHVGNLLAKRQARDRAQFVIAAYERGLVGG